MPRADLIQGDFRAGIGRAVVINLARIEPRVEVLGCVVGGVAIFVPFRLDEGAGCGFEARELGLVVGCTLIVAVDGGLGSGDEIAGDGVLVALYWMGEISLESNVHGMGIRRVNIP